LTSSYTFKPLGPAPIQDPFTARLNVADPWGSGKATGAINTLALVQDSKTKDGTLYAGSVSGGVWSRKYIGATDSWDEWKWLSSSSDYKGVQSISKLKVTEDKKWLIAAAGAVSNFNNIQGDIQDPLQLASLSSDGAFKQWLPNVENNQDLIKGHAVKALETNDNLVIIGTNSGLYVGEIDGELKKIYATQLNRNIDSIAIGASGRVYVAVRYYDPKVGVIGGIYTTTISELKQNPLLTWKNVGGSVEKSFGKVNLKLSTTKDPDSGKDVLYLGTAANNGKTGIYDYVHRVLYDEQSESQAWISIEVKEKIGSDQATYHMSFAADPTDPNNVFAGGNWYNTNPYPGRTTGGLVAIKFDGNNATLKNHFPSQDEPANAAGTAPHADSRDIAFLTTSANSKRIIEASDGGIAIKDINLMSPWKFNLNEGGLRTTESFASDWSNVGNLAITAMQDNSVSITQYKPTPTWHNITGGDGAIARFDDANKDNKPGQSFAYYGSQKYSKSGVLETSEYDKSGILTRTDRLELEVLDEFGNYQDFLNYDMASTGYDNYDNYLPFETNAYRANDIVLAGQRNLYEQIIPHWQLPTFGEMKLAPLLNDYDRAKVKRRNFTAVEIGTKKAETLPKSKPYSWDAMYASFTELNYSDNRTTEKPLLYGRKQGEATGKGQTELDLIKNFKLVNLSNNLPDIADDKLITGISLNPNNSDELWATISGYHVIYRDIPQGPGNFKEKSYLIHSSDGGNNWQTILESGNYGIPLTAQLQQVQYVPAKGSNPAELYLGGYGGVWKATVDTNGKPGAFKSVSWDGLGENPNFNLWNTELEYDPVDDVLIASIMGQGTWLLDRSQLKPAPNATPGLRISKLVLPQNNAFYFRKQFRPLEGTMTISLQRTAENLKSDVSVDLTLDAGWEEFLELTSNNQPKLDKLKDKNSITLNFAAGINQLSFYVNTKNGDATLPDKMIGVSLKNPVNSIIASDYSPGSVYLYATGEATELNQAAKGVFYSVQSPYESSLKLPPQALELAILMPRSNLNKGDKLYGFRVGSDGSVLDGQEKIIKPTDKNYLEVIKQNFIDTKKSFLIRTSTQAYDSRAFSPEKLALAFKDPNVVLSSEGISIGDIISTAGAIEFPANSAPRFAFALQDSNGNIRASTQESNLDPNLDHTLIIGKPGIGSQVVLAPAQGQLFVADIDFLTPGTKPADKFEYNLAVARFGSYVSGYGIFRVDDPYGNFHFINNKFVSYVIEPGSLEYAKEALRRSLSNGLDGITGMPIPGFAQSTKESITLATGNSYGIYITPNRTINSEDQITDLSQILFSIRNANQNQQLQHVSMGIGYFAFEDMGLAGDRDFNDMLFAITPKTSSIIG
jgi:hypothetical protein